MKYRLKRQQLSLSLGLVGFISAAGSARSETLNALTNDNQILVMDSASPEQVDRALPIQGVGDEIVIGIDYRPATGGLYAVTSEQRVYVVDTGSGEATRLAEESFAQDDSPTGYGWDFNPAVDRIRWVTAEAINRRVHPESGSMVATDGALAYAIGDSGFGLDPKVVAVGYDASANLFGIDVARDQFVSIAPANDGVLQSVGALGLLATRDAGLDVSEASGRIYAAIQIVGASGSALYEIQRDTGAATRLGTIANGSQEIVSVAVAPAPAVEPTFYTVTTLSDSMAEDGQISLREALMAANTNASVFEAPAGKPDSDAVDLIRFSDSLNGETVPLTGGSLVVTESVIIESGSLDGPIIMGNGADRVIEIAPEVKSVGLRRFKIKNGGGVERGAGVFVGAGSRVELQNVNIDDCSAMDGGGIYVDGGALTVVGGRIGANVANGPSGSGGGVFLASNAFAQFTDTTFVRNEANRAGGGIEDQTGPGLGLILDNVSMLGNNAGVSPAIAAPGNGGGLHITGPGDSEIRGGRIEGNQAAREGGGLWNGSGHMDVSSVVLIGNRGAGDGADDGGGAIFNNGGSMTITGSTLTENYADGASGSGGGLLSLDGMIHMERCMLTTNRSNRAGGAIELVDGELVFMDSWMGGPSMEDGNVAGPEGTAAPGNGGGLHVTGSAVMSIVGSTIQNNHAAREGGGLWNQSGSTMTISNGTMILDNVAAGDAEHDGGGGVFNNGGALVIEADDRPVVISNNHSLGTEGLGGGLLSIGGPVSISGLSMDSNTTMASSTIGSVEQTGSGIVQVDSSIEIANSEIGDDVLLRNAAGVMSDDVGGTLSVIENSTLRSGENPTDLSATGLAMGGESLYEFKLAENRGDRLVVNGPVALGDARLEGVAVDGFMASPGASFTLIDTLGSAAVQGQFAGQPEGSFMWVGLTTYRLSYRGGDGNDVTLSVSGVPGEMNVGINNVATRNPETGLFEQSVTITNNSETRQTGIGVFISDLASGTSLANGDGVSTLGAGDSPFRLLDRGMESREAAVLTFAFNAPVGADSVSPTYTIRSREDQIDAEQVTQIIPLVGDEALIEFETVDQATYDILYSEDLKTWKRSGPVVGQGELTQWVDRGPPVTESSLSSVGGRFYQAQRRSGDE